ncbi:MAG: membrane dipeptidase, partial [Myxococcales bacterium]|nr:membrane dipeptidase [Myxococcales bacterium]
SASAAPAPPPAPSPRLTLPEEPAVVDLHVDTPWRVHFKGRKKTLPEGHATPELLLEGGVAGIVYPIYIPDYIHDNHPTIADADEIFDTIDAIVKENDELAFAIGPGSAKERRGLEVPAGKVGVFVSIEGAGAFAEDITQIDRFIARGVRLVGPVHAHDNDLATSATGKRKGGLTDVGKKFCARVYEAGGLVDVSHMSDASFEDLVPIAAEHRAPIVATHSNARKLRGHNRNLTDDQLRIIASTGGVAGLNLHRSFVRQGKAKMQHVVAMVKHMVEVAGVDHVAVGSDFDGGTPVTPVKNASKFPALAAALEKEGLSRADVRKIFGENALRMLYWQVP